MIIYDVVRSVPPGTLSSHPVGMCVIETYDDEQKAIQYADMLNKINSYEYSGITFHVEAHPEDDYSRKPWFGDVREDGTIRNPQDYHLRKHVREWN